MSACTCGSERTLPVAVIGAGPIGLAAASHLLVRGESVLVFEAGVSVGANIRQWQHVRMFSSWQYNVDNAARQLLQANGWMAPPNDELPTGRDLLEKYLLPLSELPEMKSAIHLNAKVIGVARKNFDKLKTANRENQPFTLFVEENGRVQTYHARAVIDASGNWTNPNPVLSMGVWTPSERALRERIFYGIPNVLGEHRSRYAGKRVLVVGSGHSAINALLDLAELKAEVPETEIVWVLRKAHVSEAYGGEDRDGLPARGELGVRIRRLVESERITVLTPFYIQEIGQEKGTIFVRGTMSGEDMTVSGIDEVIAATGSRPDLSFLSEIRLSLDPALESVAALGPLIDPNIHSCGTVRPHGEKELRQPEKDFYIVGIKSYGRAPTFLLATGYEQVRSVVAGLVGDWQAAEEVHLELPETGVCKVGGPNGCCGPELEPSCCN
jgi:thioredoxin reductase